MYDYEDWESEQKVTVYLDGRFFWEGEFGDMPDDIKAACESADIIAICK